MAIIPDLRAVDPLRPGITADTVALPDIIDKLKAFNEEWGRFEDDLDVARIKEIMSICKGGEMLFRSLSGRALQVRAALRIEKFNTIQRKLEEANAKKAALIAQGLHEEEMLLSQVMREDDQARVNKRVLLLQKRIDNRNKWKARWDNNVPANP